MKLIGIVLAFSVVFVSKGIAQVDIGLSGNLGYAYRLLRPNQNLDNSILKLDEPTMGFEIGLVCRYQFSKKFSFGSGIHYSRLGISQVAIGVIVGAEERTFDFVHRFDFLSIPITAQYNVLEEKWFTPIIRIGFNNFIFLQEYVRTLEDDWRENNAFNNRTYIPALSIGIGIQSKIVEKISASITPNFTYHLMGVSNGNLRTRRHLYLAGVEFMVTYRLNKKEADD